MTALASKKKATSERVKAQRCWMGGVSPHVDAVAITLADCDNPPDAWMDAARRTLGDASAVSLKAVASAILAAARAEAEGGR